MVVPAGWRLHGRQFVISPEPLPPLPGFRTERLGSRYLHSDEDLTVECHTDRQGRTWRVLGIAVDARVGEPIREQLRRTDTADVPALTDGWAGRWVAIGDDRLYLDGAGTLGIYFHPPTGHLSSSPALLPVEDPHPPIDATDKVNWYVPPGSGFQAIRRLLPSQSLGIETLEVRHHPLLVSVPWTAYDDLLGEIKAALSRTIRQLSSRFSRTLLPLTGGYDSRLLLSLLHYHGIPAETFTLQHMSIRRADRTLPPTLAKDVGRPHSYISRPTKPPHPEAYELYRAQSAGHAIEQDQHYLAFGQFDHVTERDIVYLGGAFEVGRTYGRGIGQRRKIASEDASMGAIEATFGSLTDQAAAGFGAWLAWMQEHPEGLDWRDRFYWEQRLGGWISSCFQALDLAPGTRIAPVNSRYTLSLLLRLPLEKRLLSQHHVDLITSLAPQLARLPMNPRDPLLLRVARLPRRVARKLTTSAASH